MKERTQVTIIYDDRIESFCREKEAPKTGNRQIGKATMIIMAEQEEL